MDVLFFDQKIKNFVEMIDMPASAKIFRMFELLERFGHTLGMPHSRHIGGGLFELRTRGKQEIRLLYAFHKGAAVLLHGFIKKSQRIPMRDLEIARQNLSALDNT